MLTEAKLKITLKKLLETTSLENITVPLLCEKCGCHRQTFYYHFQDIYDLVASIFLSEQIEELERVHNINSLFEGMSCYLVKNLKFIRSVYLSGAKDLVDEFIFSKLMTKLFVVLSNYFSIDVNDSRKVARRFGRFITNEYSYLLKDSTLEPEMFLKQITSFNKEAIDKIFPSILEISKRV